MTKILYHVHHYSFDQKGFLRFEMAVSSVLGDQEQCQNFLVKLGGYVPESVVLFFPFYLFSFDQNYQFFSVFFDKVVLVC